MGFFDSWSKNTKENVVEETIMNKSELAGAISTSTGQKQGDVGVTPERFIDVFIDVVTKKLTEGNTVDLERFGTFSVKEMSDENNKATKTPVFEASEALINAVR